MEIAYTAHTESCTFMLDTDGICRWVIATGLKESRKARLWEKSHQAAARCIGAQYVASIDVGVDGGLVAAPRMGVPMLFARLDPQTGRISLVRTGPLVRFETRSKGQETALNDDSGLRHRDTLRDEDDDTWEIDTHRMARAGDAHQGGACNDEGWEIDTATTPFEVAAATLEQLRATGTNDSFSPSPQVRPAQPTPVPPKASRMPRPGARAPLPSPPRATPLPPPPRPGHYRGTASVTPPPPPPRGSRPAPEWTDRPRGGLRRVR